MILRGKVVRGSGQSTGKGFPTANINLRRQLPKLTSIAQAKIKQKVFPGIVIIGAPTKYRRKFPKIEFFSLVKLGKCYGQIIEIKNLKKIRATKKFTSQKDLIKQIKKDIKQAKQYFQNHG